MKWDSVCDTWYKPEQSLNVWSVFSNLGKGSVNVLSGMSLFDTIGFVRFPESVQPAGVPFTPKSSWALTPAALALKAELFSAPAYRDPPCSLPPATSHSAAEITLFILCIIVSSWMQKTMQTLEWIELACVHVLRTGKKGRCYVLISAFWQKMHAWLHFETPPSAFFVPLRVLAVYLKFEEDGVVIAC